MYLLWLYPALVLGSVLGTWNQSIQTTTSLFPMQQNADTLTLFPMPSCGRFNLEEATIDQMQQAMSEGTVTSQQLVVCYMQRTYQTEEYIQYALSASLFTRESLGDSESSRVRHLANCAPQLSVANKP
jgi:hypothetical protein